MHARRAHVEKVEICKKSHFGSNFMFNNRPKRKSCFSDVEQEASMQKQNFVQIYSLLIFLSESRVRY